MKKMNSNTRNVVRHQPHAGASASKINRVAPSSRGSAAKSSNPWGKKNVLATVRAAPKGGVVSATSSTAVNRAPTTLAAHARANAAGQRRQQRAQVVYMVLYKGNWHAAMGSAERLLRILYS